MKNYNKIIDSLDLRILNKENEAYLVIMDYAEKCLKKFDGSLNAVLMGIAYGGEVEAVAKLWKGKGTVYGFDTFEDLHPRHLADTENGFEATCMDDWYTKYGTEELNIEYQRKTLDKLGNAVLTKGEVHKDSCKDIPNIHLAFLDMDILKSMKIGYSAVKDKLVPGGFLFLHDANNMFLPDICEWVLNGVLSDKKTWGSAGIWRKEVMISLEKKDEKTQ